jgi:hypothetical protein
MHIHTCLTGNIFSRWSIKKRLRQAENVIPCASGRKRHEHFWSIDSDLFGEKIVRIYKKGACLRDRFTRGDVLVMRQIGGPETLPRECLVVDVGKEWITVGVGPTWPSRLWEARKILGSFRVRLDRTAPQAPLRTQKSALDLIRRGKAGDAADLLAD